MRVALFSEVVPPVHDGACRAVTNLSASLDEEGIPYQIISGVTPSPELSWGRSVHTVRSVPFILNHHYRVSLPFAPHLDAALDRFQPDILHAANPTLLGLYALSYSKRRNIPVVASYHTNYVSYFPYYRVGKMQWLGWSLLRWFHSRCRATYVPSRTTMQELRARGIPRMEFWQRGVHRDQFSPRFRSEELRRAIGAEHIPLLLYVGRLVREKDLDDLVAAVKILGARGLRFRTVIVGDGLMRPELEARLPEAHFTGYQVGPDLAAWYASADVFAFPSTTETFGNVILEAFASALPVVAVNSGGSKDLIVPDENGLLARPHDAEDFADKIASLLCDPARRDTMRECALRSAERFDWGEVNRRLIANYRQVIREHRGSIQEPAVEMATG